MFWLGAVNAPDWIALGPGLDRVLACGVAGVDIRIASMTHGPSTHERALSDRVHAAGLRVRCHAWVGHRSGEVAAVDASMGARDGHIAGAQCAEMHAEAFGVNAERDVWRGPGGRAHPHAVDYLDAFASLFYEANHDDELDYVGFADPRWHYRDGDLDGDGVLDNELPAELRQRYRRVGVMAYQTRTADVVTTIKRAAQRWPEHAANGRLVPWLGVGRVDRTGRVVGSPEATREAYRLCGEAVLYVGFGAVGQLLDGHDAHPPLVDLVPQLVEAT